MFYLSQLSQDSMTFVNRVLSSSSNRELGFGLALAHAVSRKIALPSTSVDNITEYYILNAKALASKLVSDVNEIVPCVPKDILVNVEAFYKHRYYMAFGHEFPSAIREDRGIADFFGLTTFFGDGVLDYINKNPAKITVHLGGINKIIADFEKARQTDWREVGKNPGENKDTVYVA